MTERAQNQLTSLYDAFARFVRNGRFL
jgi:hypothetical protein